jgi:hypothetical protein
LRIVLRIFESKRDKVEGENYIMRCLIFCTHHPILLGDKIEKSEMGGPCSTYGGRGEAYTGFWWGKLRERDQLGDSGVDGRIIIRWIFRKWDVGVWTGSSWLKIGTGGGNL